MLRTSVGLLVLAAWVLEFASPADAACFKCGTTHDLQVSDNYLQTPLLPADGAEHPVTMRVRNDGPYDAEDPVYSIAVSAPGVQVARVVEAVSLQGTGGPLTCGPGPGTVTAVCTGGDFIQDGDTHLLDVYLKSRTTRDLTVTLGATAKNTETAPGDNTNSVAVSFDASCTATPGGGVACGNPRPPSPGNPNPGPGGPAPGGTDPKPPVATVNAATPRLAAFGRRGLPVTVTCSTACDVSVKLKVSRKAAKALGLGKRARMVGSGKVSRSSAGAVTVKAKPTKALKRALRKHSRLRSLKLAVRVEVSGPGGKAKPIAKAVTVRKRGGG